MKCVVKNDKSYGRIYGNIKHINLCVYTEGQKVMGHLSNIVWRLLEFNEGQHLDVEWSNIPNLK